MSLKEDNTDNKPVVNTDKPVNPALETCIKEQVSKGLSEEEAKTYCEMELKKSPEEDNVPSQDNQVQEITNKPPEPSRHPQPAPPQQQDLNEPVAPGQPQPSPDGGGGFGTYDNFEMCLQDQLSQGLDNKDAVVNCAVQLLQTMESNGQATPVPMSTGKYDIDGTVFDVAAFPGGFEQCVHAMKGNGMDKEGAITKCERIFNKSKIKKADTFANYIQVETAKDDTNKLYIRAFLLDPSVNVNKWGVSEASLEERIHSFVGKPLVLTEDLGHPELTDMSLAHALEYQDIYRIGTIIDVVKIAKDPYAPKIWYAVCEITDEKAKEAFRKHKLPLYVSPAVAHVDAEDESNIDAWLGMHLALVDKPAFGVKKAMITGSCSGDADKCVMHLKQAKIEKFGYGNCGFCVYEKLVSVLTAKETPKVLQVGENKNPELVTVDPKSVNSSLTSENTQEQLTMSQTENKDIAKDETKVETNKEVKEEKLTYRTEPLGLLDARLVKLETENTLLKENLKLARDENEKLVAENAHLAKSNRRAEIASIVTAEVIADPEERTKLIDRFTDSGVTPTMVADIYNTVRGTYKTAKEVTYDSRSPLIKTASKKADGKSLAKDIRNIIIRGDSV